MVLLIILTHGLIIVLKGIGHESRFFYSYLSAARGFGFLGALLLSSWRSSLQGRLLTFVVIVSVAWAVVAASVAGDTYTLTGYFPVTRDPALSCLVCFPAEEVVAQATAGGHVLIMSNGGFGGIYEKRLYALSQA